MRKWHKDLNADRWNRFSKKEQLLMIGAELLRAKDWLERGDIQSTKDCYERALELIDLTLSDERWQGSRRALLRIREAIAYVYLETGHPSLCQVFYDQLLGLSE